MEPSIDMRSWPFIVRSDPPQKVRDEFVPARRGASKKRVVALIG